MLIGITITISALNKMSPHTNLDKTKTDSRVHNRTLSAPANTNKKTIFLTVLRRIQGNQLELAVGPISSGTQEFLAPVHTNFMMLGINFNLKTKILILLEH